MFFFLQMLTCFKSHSAFTGKRTDFSIQRLLREEYLDSISEEGRKKSNCIGCTVTTFSLHWYCAGTLNCFTIFIMAIGADGVLQKKWLWPLIDALCAENKTANHTTVPFWPNCNFFFTFSFNFNC